MKTRDSRNLSRSLQTPTGKLPLATHQVRCSYQIASDLKELKDISRFLEKLQDTVNVNNWDELIDSFKWL